MRQVPPWVGKTPDTPAPPRVRVRIFDAYDGICQCGCKRKIRAGEAWQLDHYVAIANGGANSELNMRPMLTEHHKNKTVADVKQKSKTYRIRCRNLGVKLRKGKPMPCGRSSKHKKKIGGEVVLR